MRARRRNSVQQLMGLIAASLALLILCAIRWHQLTEDRRRRAETAPHRVNTAAPARQARVRAPSLIPPIVEPEQTAKERWMAQAMRANPGLTQDAAATLYERFADSDADPTTYGMDGS